MKVSALTIALLLCMGFASAVKAEKILFNDIDPLEFSSPSGHATLSLSSNDGKACFRLSTENYTFLRDSCLGFTVDMQGKSNTFLFTSARETLRRENIERPHGESSKIIQSYNRIDLDFLNADQRIRLRLTIHLFDSSLAYKFSFFQDNDSGFEIIDEEHTFGFPEDLLAYTEGAMEAEYRAVRLSDMKSSTETPLTLVGDSTYYAIHEAQRRSYSKSHLQKHQVIEVVDVDEVVLVRAAAAAQARAHALAAVARAEEVRAPPLAAQRPPCAGRFVVVDVVVVLLLLHHHRAPLPAPDVVAAPCALAARRAPARSFGPFARAAFVRQRGELP